MGGILYIQAPKEDFLTEQTLNCYFFITARQQKIIIWRLFLRLRAWEPPNYKI